MMWLWLSAGFMVITAIIHSVAGEKRLIGPILAKKVIPSAQSQRVLRGAWHLTSLFMVSNAAVILWPNTPSGLHIIIGVFWLLIGMFSLVSSKGKHVGWPTLTAAGLTAVIGASM